MILKYGREKLNQYQFSYIMPEQREYVITLRNAGFAHGKKKAAHATRILREFLQERVGKDKIVIDNEVNSLIWAHGIKNFPRRISVVLERSKNDEPWVVKLKGKEVKEAPPSVQLSKDETQQDSGEPVGKSV